MKKKIILFIYILGILHSTSAQTFNITIDKGIDGLFNILERDSSFIGLINSGYPIYPALPNFFDLNKNGAVLKLSESGSMDYYSINYSLLSNSYGFVACCFDFNFNFNIHALQLLYFNFNLDSIDSKLFYPPIGYDYYGDFVIKCSDGGYLMTGEIADTNLSDGNLLIFKTDSNGNYQWHKSYGGNKFDAGVSSVELPDKGFLSVGWTRSFGFGSSGNRDIYLVRTDSLGNFIWQKTFGTSNHTESAYGITKTSDGNYLIAGNSGIQNNYNFNPWIIKIDSSGAIIWSKIITDNPSGEVWWARETPTKDIVCAGSYRAAPTNAFKDDGYILLIDSSGNEKWHRTFNVNNDHSYFRDVQPTTDGGYICAGFVFTGASGNQDAWIVKLDSLGCDSDGCAVYTGIANNPSQMESAVSVYPNPVTDLFFIRFDVSMNEDKYEVFIYNTEGKLVVQKILLTTLQSTPVYVGELSSGIYLARIKAGDKIYSVKFVKE